MPTNAVIPNLDTKFRGNLHKHMPHKHIYILYLLVLTIGITGYIKTTPPSSLELTQEVEAQASVLPEVPEKELQIIQLYSKNPKVEQEIYQIAEEHNFQWPEYLIKLAQCESRMDPSATNNQGNKPATSVDRGLFQINSYWHSNISDECALDIRCATEYTIKMINSGRQHEWVCNNKVKNVPIKTVMSW